MASKLATNYIDVIVKLKEFAEELGTVQAQLDALMAPVGDVIKNSALAEMNLPTDELVAATQREINKVTETWKMPPLDSALFEVHEPTVRLLEPVRVELPELPSWWSRNWIGLLTLLATTAALTVAIIALVRTL